MKWRRGNAHVKSFAIPIPSAVVRWHSLVGLGSRKVLTIENGGKQLHRLWQ